MQRGDSVRRYDVARREWVNSLTPRERTESAVASFDTREQRPFLEFNAAPVIDDLPKEYVVTIEINGKPVATLLCTPSDLREPGAGWVFGHGFARTASEVRTVTIRENRVSVMIDAPGPGGAAWQTLIEAGFDASSFCRKELDDLGLMTLSSGSEDTRQFISPPRFLALMNYVFEAFRQACNAGGHHHAASIDVSGEMVAMRDLSRHCAVDKVIGRSILCVATGELRILCLSGRVSADIMLKAWRAGFPVVATRSVPTADAIRIANAAGITVVGRVLDGRRAIYTNPWRLGSEHDRFTA